MEKQNHPSRPNKKLFSLLGSILLLLIIPVKTIRWVDPLSNFQFLIGVAPSFLGTAGLFYLLLSADGKLAQWSPLRIAILTLVISLGLEFLQLLPRPGILSHIHYTFDWWDVGFSIVGILIAYSSEIWMRKRRHEV